MQLAGGLFLDRSDRSFRRKMQETLLAIQIERNYTKQQIFTMYANQVYLAHGNYGFEAASEFYFGRPVGKLTLPEAALLAALIRGPAYSPITNPKRALDRRNLVLDLMQRDGKITTQQERQAQATTRSTSTCSRRETNWRPILWKRSASISKRTYGTEAVHEHGLRVYTTLNIGHAARRQQRRTRWLARLRAAARLARQSPQRRPRQTWRRCKITMTTIGTGPFPKAITSMAWSWPPTIRQRS